MFGWRGKGFIGTLITAGYSRRLSSCSNSDANTQSIVTLYQYRICPFCCRVKSYLDYLKVPYNSVEVNPLTKSQLSFSKEYKKVPIALIDGAVVSDSSNIIAKISEKLTEEQKKELFTEDTEVWSEWSEKKLAVMLYPNITRTLAESWECFGYTSEVAEWNVVNQAVTRVAGAAFMSLANGKIKKKYGIVDERKELDEVLQQWTGALRGTYLHGDRVTMPDLMVHGVLRAIKDFQTFRDIMTANARLRVWYENVSNALDSK